MKLCKEEVNLFHLFLSIILYVDLCDPISSELIITQIHTYISNIGLNKSEKY